MGPGRAQRSMLLLRLPNHVMAGLDPAIHAAAPRARRSVWRHGGGGGPHPALPAPPVGARNESGHDDMGERRKTGRTS